MRITFLVATLLGTCAMAASASAEVIVVEPAINSGKDADFDRAKASSADANKAYEADDIPAALAHAEAAYRSYPNASTAMQMANIYVATENHSKAFRWFLLARNHKPPEAFVDAIKAGLETHGRHARLGVVHIKTSPEGASVSVDNGAGSTVGGRYIGLSFGDHTLEVTAQEHTSVSQKVTVISAGIVTARVTLQAVQATNLTSTPPETETSASIVLPLALVLSGVVVAGGGAGMLAWGLGSSGDAADSNGSFDPNSDNEAARQSYLAMQTDAEIGNYAGYAMLGLGGALLITGAVLWATLPSASTGEGTADVVVSPSILRSGGGVVLGGAF